MAYYAETLEQIALIDWARFHPILKHLLFAIANGDLRDKFTAKTLKRMGVKAGIPDLFLAWPVVPWHGLFIEMKSKAKSAKLSEKQIEMMGHLQGAGYLCVCAKGFDMAKKLIEDYLKNDTSNHEEKQV